MPSILLSAPAIEPVTLDEAKLFLRVEHADDDALISALIAAARMRIEAAARRALITQSWRLVRDAWPADGRFSVLPAPLRAILAVRVFDTSGIAQSIDLGAFAADTASAPAAIAFMPWSLTRPGRAVAGIEVDIEAGYGATPADVPEPLRQAIRLLTAHWYENRNLSTTNAEGTALPQSISALIAPYRVVSL